MQKQHVMVQSRNFPLCLSIIWIYPSFPEDQDHSATRKGWNMFDYCESPLSHIFLEKSHHEIVRCVHRFTKRKRIHRFRHIGAETVHAVVEEVGRVWDRHRQSTVATLLSRVICHSWQEWVLTNLIMMITRRANEHRKNENTETSLSDDEAGKERKILKFINIKVWRWKNQNYSHSIWQFPVDVASTAHVLIANFGFSDSALALQQSTTNLGWLQFSTW